MESTITSGNQPVSQLSVKAVAKALSGATREAGLSVDEIADLSGVSRMTVSRVFKTAPNAFPKSDDSDVPRKFYCDSNFLNLAEETKPRLIGKLERFFTTCTYADVVEQLALAGPVFDKMSEAAQTLKVHRTLALEFAKGEGPHGDEEEFATLAARLPKMADNLRGMAVCLDRMVAHPSYGTPSQFLILIDEPTEEPKP